MNEYYHNHLTPSSLKGDGDNEEKTTCRHHSSCSYCKEQQQQFNQQDPLNPLELQTLSLTPPLDNIYYEKEEPFSCIYLLNLFLAPDMTRYLKEAPISDDIYNLPCLYLQKLVCEARMDAMTGEKQGGSALKRLEKLRVYITTVAHRDTEAIISTLNELIHNEDELTNIVND